MGDVINLVITAKTRAEYDDDIDSMSEIIIGQTEAILALRIEIMRLNKALEESEKLGFWERMFS